MELSLINQLRRLPTRNTGTLRHNFVTTSLASAQIVERRANQSGKWWVIYIHANSHLDRKSLYCPEQSVGVCVAHATREVEFGHIVLNLATVEVQRGREGRLHHGPKGKRILLTPSRKEPGSPPDMRSVVASTSTERYTLHAFALRIAMRYSLS
jgi:hypothetical protein